MRKWWVRRHFWGPRLALLEPYFATSSFGAESAEDSLTQKKSAQLAVPAVPPGPRAAARALQRPALNDQLNDQPRHITRPPRLVLGCIETDFGNPNTHVAVF